MKRPAHLSDNLRNLLVRSRAIVDDRSSEMEINAKQMRLQPAFALTFRMCTLFLLVVPTPPRSARPQTLQFYRAARLNSRHCLAYNQRLLRRFPAPRCRRDSFRRPRCSFEAFSQRASLYRCAYNAADKIFSLLCASLYDHVATRTSRRAKRAFFLKAAIFALQHLGKVRTTSSWRLDHCVFRVFERLNDQIHHLLLRRIKIDVWRNANFDSIHTVFTRLGSCCFRIY